MLEAKIVAVSFVDAINTQDMEALAALMGDEHLFTDSLGNFYAGCAALKKAWRDYFAAFPNYRIEIDEIYTEGQRVLLIGKASGRYSADCTSEENSWQIPMVWKALVAGYHVREWSVYGDMTAIANANHRGN